MGDSSKNSTSLSGADAQGLVLVVGLGGNLGNTSHLLWDAVCRLKSDLNVIGVSSLYKTAPIGPSQPDFLNAAVQVIYPRTIVELLSYLQSVELEFGRVRNERWGPRSLDLDILWAKGRISRTSTLTVPHAELARRAFALVPLLELVPTASDPENGVSYRSILDGLKSQRIERITSKEWREAVP